MQATFSSAPATLVESITTLPSLAILFFIALSPLFTNKIGYRKTALLGLGTSFVAGVLPFFASNIWMVLICRLFFGAGIGLLNPMAASISSYFYKGNERAQMLGLSGTMSNLASALLTMLAGLLLTISWRTSFLSYFVLLLIFLLVWAVLPEMDLHDGKKHDSFWSQFKKLNKRIYVFFGYYFVIQLMLEGMIIKYSSLVTSKGMGSAAKATFIMSFMSIAGMIVGIVFAPVFKVLNNALLPILIVVMSAGLFGLSMTNSFVWSGIFLITVTAPFTFAPAFLFYQIAEVAPKPMVNFCNSTILIFCNISVFLTPYIFGSIATITKNSSPSSAMFVAGVIGLVMLVVVLIIMKIAPVAPTNSLNDNNE